MYPFDSYPTEEEELLKGLRNTGNCRHGYGLDLQQRTGQTHCAYCGESLVDEYRHWLMMSVDHVVPVQEALRLGAPREFINGLVNQVLCCSACNGFLNRFTDPDEQPRAHWALQDFIELRNRMFRKRSEQIAKRRTLEIQAFHERRWEDHKKAA